MTTPPGWYPDPQLPATMRWWDGAGWTASTSPQYGSPSGPPPTSPFGNPSGTSPWVTPGGGQWGVQQPPAVYYATGRKHGRRFWWIFGVSAFLVIGAIGTVIVVALVSAVRGVIAPTEQANAYLRDLQDQNFTSAYARLCVSDRREVSPSRFAESKTAHHPLSYSLGVASVTVLEGVKTATVDYTETSSDAGSQSEHLTLQDTIEGWRVCHPGISPDDWAGLPTTQAPAAPALPADYRRADYRSAGVAGGATTLRHSD